MSDSSDQVGNYEVDCDHRILSMTPAEPGTLVAVWHGDAKHVCSIEQRVQDIKPLAVQAWLLVEHRMDEGRVVETVVQTVEPWAPNGMLMSEFGDYGQLSCNTNYVYRSAPGHCDMRVYGSLPEISARIAELEPDECMERAVERQRQKEVST